MHRLYINARLGPKVADAGYNALMARRHRTQEDVARVREQLLVGAAQALEQHGVHRATMDDIARACGCTPPTLYAYFEGKDAILEAIVRTVARESADLLTLRVPEGLTLPQRLELVLEPTLQWGKRRAAMIRVAGTAVASGATPSEWVGKDPMPHYVSRLESLLREEGAEKWLGHVPPEEAAYLLWGLIHGQGLYVLSHPGAEAKSSDARLIVRRFLAALTVGHTQDLNGH